MRHLDLFSGIGGFALGLQIAGGFETVGFCEVDPYCQKILNQHWPEVPVHSDVREINAEEFRGVVDLLTGGYPCQPFSNAGRREGEEDDRHLWPEMFRLVKGIRPTWVIGENVIGHFNLGLDNVLSDLEAEGYAARPYIIPACAIDARHRRDRIFIIAHTDSARQQSGQGAGQSNRQERNNTGRICPDVADTQEQPERPGLRKDKSPREWRGRSGYCCGQNHVGNTLKPGLERYTGDGNQGREPGWLRKEAGRSACEAGLFGWGYQWPTEPGVGRVANGISNRVDRIKALGNAVVPQLVAVIGNMIMQVEEQKHVGSVDSRKSGEDPLRTGKLAQQGYTQAR